MEELMTVRNKLKTKLTERFPELSTWLYLGALSIYILAMSLKGTMLVDFLITQRGIFYLSALPAFLVLLKIVFLDEHDLKDLVIFFLLEVVLFAVGTSADEFLIFYFLFFIVGAQGINIDQILKVFLGVNLFVIWLVLGGWLRDATSNDAQFCLRQGEGLEPLTSPAGLASGWRGRGRPHSRCRV